MYILGFSCYYHDSSACIVKDGKVIAAADEERFTRKKHDTRFPKAAIDYCLHEAGLKNLNDVDYIAFYEKPFLKFERGLHTVLEDFPKGFMNFYHFMPRMLNEKLRIPSTLKKEFKYTGKIMYIPHHMAHAASSYLVSPFKDAAIVTVDGVGEWATTAVGHGKGNDIKIIKQINFPHSLGLLYAAITAFLGFKVNNDEFKVMGLSAYGKPIYKKEFEKLIDLKDDGSFKLNMEYFDFTHSDQRMYSDKLLELFGKPREREGKMNDHYKNIAATVQAVFEEAYFKIMNHAYQVTKSKNLCVAGGTALNSLANGKISKNTPFKNIYIQPSAGDSGTAIGAAMYVYNTLLGKKRNYIMEDVYLGPGYSRKFILDWLKKSKINYEEIPDSKLMPRLVKLMKQDHVIGFYQGRMEWGPRALGNRSILATPINPDMKDILNSKVKRREMFRPFAPVVLKEKMKEYFETDKEVPFMLYVYPIVKDKRKIIASITHVDGTGRLQSIEKKKNPRYYEVIKEFENQTGVPVLINTSFNIRGEPIVCTPMDAYRCFMGTGIDYLVIDNFFIDKEKNKKDIWNSEFLATQWR